MTMNKLKPLFLSFEDHIKFYRSLAAFYSQSPAWLTLGICNFQISFHSLHCSHLFNKHLQIVMLFRSGHFWSISIIASSAIKLLLWICSYFNFSEGTDKRRLPPKWILYTYKYVKWSNFGNISLILSNIGRFQQKSRSIQTNLLILNV
jgi:hypothetical protein